MTLEIPHLAQNWRTNTEKLRLIGLKCPDCNHFHFPRKNVCDNCGGELLNHVEGMGTITAILDNKENGERTIEITYIKKNEQRKIEFGLNGMSHSLKIEINTPATILSRKPKRYSPIFSFELTSSSSK